MILLVETTAVNEDFRMNLFGSDEFDFDVFWGETDTNTGLPVTDSYRGKDLKHFSHTYASAGSYNVTISARRMERWNGCQTHNLVDVLQWGTYDWYDVALMFDNCKGLRTISASDSPHLMRTRSMEYMFANCDLLNADLDHWDVSNVKWMGSVFRDAVAFNGSIGQWDTRSAIATDRMFMGATSFNRDISNWDVSSVTNMQAMFNYADNFNQPIGRWDVSGVTNMDGMFANTEKSTRAFNQPIEDWDVSRVEIMSCMFCNTESFNQNLFGWGDKMKELTSVEWMFFRARAFNQDISSWEQPKVTSHYRYLQFASSFNKPIHPLKGDLTLALVGTKFNQDISGWDATKITKMFLTFPNTLDQDLSRWDVEHLLIRKADGTLDLDKMRDVKTSKILDAFGRKIPREKHGKAFRDNWDAILEILTY